MNAHTHAPGAPAETKGLVLRWGAVYDVVVNLLTLGRARQLRDMTIDLSLVKSGESLLDVGCATGAVTLPAKKRVGENGFAAGIDPAPEMIAAASRKAARKGLDVDFRIGVIEDLPYPDASFDVVTSSLMMHHLTPEVQKKGLAEVFRVLKPDGRLLIVDTVRPRGFLLKKIFDALSHRHGIRFGVEDLLTGLKSAGFPHAVQLDRRFLGLGFVRAVKGTR